MHTNTSIYIPLKLSTKVEKKSFNQFYNGNPHFKTAYIYVPKTQLQLPHGKPTFIPDEWNVLGQEL